jgi:hypothetical protein
MEYRWKAITVDMRRLCQKVDKYSAVVLAARNVDPEGLVDPTRA